MRIVANIIFKRCYFSPFSASLPAGSGLVLEYFFGPPVCAGSSGPQAPSSLPAGFSLKSIETSFR
jgi:hypothetical protein